MGMSPEPQAQKVLMLHPEFVSSPNAFWDLKSPNASWDERNAFGDNHQHKMHFGTITPTSKMKIIPKCISLHPNTSRDIPNGFSFCPTLSDAFHVKRNAFGRKMKLPCNCPQLEKISYVIFNFYHDKVTTCG
jgi:hypothetical protein